MTECTAFNTISVSERRRAVTISLRFQVDFRQPEGNLEIQGPLMLSPNDLVEKLWSDGIDAGIRRATREAWDIFSITGIYIGLKEWVFSEPVSEFDEEELRRVISELESLTYAALYPILSQRTNQEEK